MRIIDSSSLAKYVNREENWEQVSELLAAEPTATIEFALQEVGNSIWKRVVRREVTKENATTVFQEFVGAVMEDSLVTLVPLEADLLKSSLELAIGEKITLYDCAFIELAHKKKWGLITSDEEQSNISKKRHSKLRVVYVR